MDDALGHWIAGFTDGEGCFIISRRSRTNGGSDYACNFQIVVRDDDAAVIEVIRDATGIGSIIRRTADDMNPQIGWSVRRKDDCLKLVELFDRYPLRSKKARDYARWREAVIAWCGIKRVSHGRRGVERFDWSVIAAARTALMDGRKYACEQS